MKSECEVCKASPLRDSKVILTRVNRFGVPGIWRCEKCLTPEQRKQRDPETHRLCEIITGQANSVVKPQ